MTFELFRFANLVANMSFVSESDYDSGIGTITVTDEGFESGYVYWETFDCHTRNRVMAEALRVCAAQLEKH